MTRNIAAPAAAKIQMPDIAFVDHGLDLSGCGCPCAFHCACYIACTGRKSGGCQQAAECKDGHEDSQKFFLVHSFGYFLSKMKYVDLSEKLCIIGVGNFNLHDEEAIT